MPITSILIGLALLAATIPFVAKPLLNDKRRKPAAIDSSVAVPHNRHAQTLTALRDLDFDHRTGKITDEDYAGLRAALLAQAAEAIEQEDRQSAERDALIEDAVRARRQHKTDSLACGQCGAALQVNDRFCRRCGAPATSLCPHCGHAAGADDRFCTACGTSLIVSPAVAS